LAVFRTSSTNLRTKPACSSDGAQQQQTCKKEPTVKAVPSFACQAISKTVGGNTRRRIECDTSPEKREKKKN
jgi:hypothetical protein